MPASCKKGEFDRCFNRLDRLVEKSRPDGYSTGAGRPDRFPSLAQSDHKPFISRLETDSFIFFLDRLFVLQGVRKVWTHSKVKYF